MGGSLSLGQVQVGQSVKKAVIVRNISGPATLTGITASVTAGDFAITQALAGSSIGPGGNDALLITFTPSGPGTRTATLTITSDDSDEASFEVPLTGEGVPRLLDAISQAFDEEKTERLIAVPFTDGRRRAWLHAEGVVVQETPTDTGFAVTVRWTARQEKRYRDLG